VCHPAAGDFAAIPIVRNKDRNRRCVPNSRQFGCSCPLSGHALAQRLFRPLAVGDVSVDFQYPDRMCRFVPHENLATLDRDLFAVAPRVNQFPIPAALTGEGPIDVCRRDFRPGLKEIMGYPPHHFGVRPAVHLRSADVPRPNHAASIHDEDGVVRKIDEQSLPT
jgi:hypothetical protein